MFIFSLIFGLFSGAADSAAQEQNSAIVVLPLKINADSDIKQLTRTTDQTFIKVLEEQGLTMLSRDVAEQKFDFQKSWPPKFDVLGPLSLTSETDYLVAGSLTRSGAVISIDIAVFDLLDESQAKYFFEEGDSIAELPVMLSRITYRIISYTDRYSRISKISINGNKKIDTGAIIQKIMVESGDRYNQGKLRQSIKEIYKMGYFDNISIEAIDTEQGRELTFIVTEKPVIGDIDIVGEHELDEEDILEVIELVPNNIISTRDVQESIDNIKQLYKDKGLYNTKVSAELSSEKDGKIDVELRLKEGKKVYIKEISFSGNKAFKTGACRARRCAFIDDI